MHFCTYVACLHSTVLSKRNSGTVSASDSLCTVEIHLPSPLNHKERERQYTRTNVSGIEYLICLLKKRKSLRCLCDLAIEISENKRRELLVRKLQCKVRDTHCKWVDILFL